MAAPGGAALVIATLRREEGAGILVTHVAVDACWQRGGGHMRIGTTISVILALGVGVLGILGGWAAEGPGGHMHMPGLPPSQPPEASVRISMEALHQHGGVPPGWRFTLPAGDPTAGHAVFAKLECYQCHTIQGEHFSPASIPPGGTGPELTGMGSHHPAEYVAESIVNPNAVIVTGPGYTGADGLSIMPDYRHSLTVAELMDLVAYLTSLQGEHGHAADMAQHGDDSPPPPAALREALVGNYRVRLVYLAREAGGHGHGSHASGTATAHADHHVMVVITNANTGESVPYLPVTMTPHGAPQPARPITLKPMLGDEGFHYGADFTVPVTGR
jgi:mono/diheme cytochrome c family protein